VAHVGAERVDRPLCAVQGERIEPATLFDPESGIEALAERRGLIFEPVRELGFLPGDAGDLGETPFGVEDISLYLAGRDWPVGNAPVRESLRVVRVLPAVVQESTLCPPLVLDEPVPVSIAVTIDPGEGT
jgi:hypothetical protein